LWLTGGPGCSSLLALFVENGPYKIEPKSLNLTINPYSWNSFANVIWVDQPVGTGFSYADSIFDWEASETTIANDMYTFIQEFFGLHKQYSALPFFILGESYAGHYVPAIATRMLAGNQNHDGPFIINMKGAGIGNGFVDPLIQYGVYAPFAYENGLIDEAERLVFDGLYGTCAVLIETRLIPLAIDTCNGIIEGVQVAGGDFNVYDIRLPCSDPPLCYNFDYLGRFLNQAKVQQALGVVPPREWVECDTLAHLLLTIDWFENYETEVPAILAANVSVLVYSGMLDFICNYLGGEAWTAKMPWTGQAAFNAANFTSWNVNSSVAGYVKAAEGLTFLEVVNAGHMVPMDQPANALDMLRRFLNNLPFN